VRDPSLPPYDIAGNGDSSRRSGPVPGGRRPIGGPYQGPAGAYRRPAERPVPDAWRPAGALSNADEPPVGRLPYEAPDAPPRGGALDPQDDEGDDTGPDDDKAPKGGRHSRRARKGKGPRSPARTIIEWVLVIGGGIAIALIIEAVFIQAFWIPSASMVPTLEVDDRVLVNKLSYRLHDVNHGDVVVFERPASVTGDESIKDLIKRVIAVGGDTIEARNGFVYLNGERLDEDYLPEGTVTDELPPTEVPEGEVFVMGDNRGDSQDSRKFGPIPEDAIIGRAFIKVLPLHDIGWL
jgi:signal peptidase I